LRNTASTSSFLLSSLAEVLVPSQRASIQRSLLVLTPVLPFAASLKTLPPRPGYTDGRYSSTGSLPV
jgi:hypothetical protein